MYGHGDVERWAKIDRSTLKAAVRSVSRREAQGEVMKTDAVIAELTEAIDMIDRYDENGRPDRAGRYVNLHADTRELGEEIRERLPALKRLVEAIDPELNRAGVGFHYQQLTSGRMYWDVVRSTLVQARGALSSRPRVDDMLEPEGPTAQMDRFHPWVWNAAAKLWDGGHEREAVQKAALNIELEMRSKYNRPDMDASQILEQAFGLGPANAETPRWRLPGYTPGTDDFKSAHLGAMQFGKGCYAAIRNLATHRLEISEAVEQLAALSLLARWVDAAATEVA